MKLTLGELFLWKTELPVIVYSIDMVGYQAFAVIGGQECLLVDTDGKPLRKKSLMAMREVLQGMPVSELFLKHQSAYDEMINQPCRQLPNTLQVPLSLDPYPILSESSPAA